MNAVRRALLALALVASVPAAWADEPYYVTPPEVDLTRLMPPPPVPGSARERRDMAAVLDAVRDRTPAQVERARADSLLSAFRFADVLGPEFTPEGLPFSAVFFRRVAFDANTAIQDVKAHYNRPRPFMVDPRVELVVPQPPNASYPSGHASFAYLHAALLAEMVPEKAAALFARADEYASERVLAGAHYPSDLEAGRISAAVVGNVLLHDARFLRDFAAARAEVRGALRLE